MNLSAVVLFLAVAGGLTYCGGFFVGLLTENRKWSTIAFGFGMLSMTASVVIDTFFKVGVFN